MTTLRVKLAICLVWTIFLTAIFFTRQIPTVDGQARPTGLASLTPDRAVIDRFDHAVRNRFLTAPSFGMARMAPVGPQPTRSRHLEQFSPNGEDEVAGVTAFERNGWNAALYLFGRRATPIVKNGKDTPKFDVHYRLNEPLPITTGLKLSQVPKPKGMIEEIRKAFIDFQTPDSPNAENYEFRIGKWSYIARPVRAVNESCITCHSDFVITEKLAGGQYKFRPRQVGDANGVIVYAFARPD